MNADLDNPEVEYAAMPNNTEHREMIDLDVQLHEENEVEFVEDNDGEDEEEIFRAFCQWLQTADGGRRDRKMAKQHSSQVRKILVIIDPEKRLSSLFNKNLIRDKFLVDYAEKMYKPDTVKAHLLSLRNFCSFVKTEEPSSVMVDVATIEKKLKKKRVYSHPPTKRIVTADIWKNKMKTFKSWLHQKWCRSSRIVNQRELQLLILAK